MGVIKYTVHEFIEPLVDRKLLEYRQRSKYVPSTASYYVVDLNTGKSYGPDLEEFVELLRTFIDFKDGSS